MVRWRIINIVLWIVLFWYLAHRIQSVRVRSWGRPVSIARPRLCVRPCICPSYSIIISFKQKKTSLQLLVLVGKCAKAWLFLSWSSNQIVQLYEYMLHKYNSVYLLLYPCNIAKQIDPRGQCFKGHISETWAWNKISFMYMWSIKSVHALSYNTQN